MLDCPAPYVVDGDSIRCGRERLRLLGIDAPETGFCPPHRTCIRGDGKASRRSLQAALRNGRVRYRIVTRDHFGRAVVLAWAGGVRTFPAGSCKRLRLATGLLGTTGGWLRGPVDRPSEAR